ncbi:hypothetical protein [Actinophytocola sp.]|uniref:hypothetical protein n=1 Tax=Actinophytocola sp. TaxID=1872138 RepID=UPI002D761A3B|nr:hypothetical protein [Actinophytocola sp.]HYQ64772.1 hypothetical protein [Actinophytocola sp.]
MGGTSGPAFRYGEFQFHEPVPGVDTTVEQERKRHAEESSPRPGGLIGQRLSGEGES